MMPATEVMDIPVRALSIKLGDGEPMSAEAQKMAEQNNLNQTAVENIITKIAREQDMEAQERAKSVLAPMDKAIEKDNETLPKALDKAIAGADTAQVQDSAQKLSAIAKQFVRNNNVQAPSSKGTGNVLGNSTAKEAELMSRYEQLISMWIEKFKLYPNEARAQGMQGETVVRIRIDRKGNIRYYILERSTGYQVLDRAAIDMVKRANPVPSVPNDYPPGDLIEFLIPVNFHLQ
jgi:periplasmic protein TonB